LKEVRPRPTKSEILLSKIIKNFTLPTIALVYAKRVLIVILSIGVDLASNETKRRFCFREIEGQADSGPTRVARWVVFNPKIPIWENFGGP
jgi:hypothetical protein